MASSARANITAVSQKRGGARPLTPCSRRPRPPRLFSPTDTDHGPPPNIGQSRCISSSQSQRAPIYSFRWWYSFSVLASSRCSRHGRWGSWRARAVDLGRVCAAGGGGVGKDEGGNGETRRRGVIVLVQQRLWRGRRYGRGALPHAEAPAGSDQERGQEGLPAPHANVSSRRLQAEEGRRRRGFSEDQRGVPDADEQHEGGRGEARVLAPQVRPHRRGSRQVQVLRQRPGAGRRVARHVNIT